MAIRPSQRLIILFGVLILPIGITNLPMAKASGPCTLLSYNMVLPFSTGWEQGNCQPGYEAVGTTTCACNQVYQKNVNLWAYGGSNGSDPNLSLYNGPPGDSYQINFPSPGAYGYTYGGTYDVWYMEASGHFGNPGASGVLRLFDSSPQSDAHPPFLLQPHVFLNVWYYHKSNGINSASNNIMIDANLYNSHTQQSITLGTFRDAKGNYIVDQNGVRLNAASRTTDPAGRWAHAEFDLSAVYNSDSGPNNWSVTMVTVRFDNSLSGLNGDALTFFDDVRFTYGFPSSTKVELKNTSFSNVWNGTLIIVASAEVWSRLQIGNTYQITVKLGTLAWSNASVKNCSYGNDCPILYPSVMTQTISNGGGANSAGFVSPGQLTYYAPFGNNVTSLNSTRPNAWVNFFYGNAELGATTLIGLVPIAGPILTGAYSEGKLVKQLYQELNPPTQSASSYIWPTSDMNTMAQFAHCGSDPSTCGAKPNGIQGIAFAQFTAPGTGGIVTLTDLVSFTYSSPTPSGLPGPYSIPLTITWPGASPLTFSVGASPTDGILQVTVYFTSSCSGGTTYGSTSPYSYYWQFNDGNGATSTLQNPSYTYHYLQAGSGSQTFYPTLMVTDQAGVVWYPGVPSITVTCTRICPEQPLGGG